MNHALQLIGFMELPEEDRPPERIWRNPKRLNEHFDAVRHRYAAKSRGETPLDSGDGGGEMQNPATAGLRR